MKKPIIWVVALGFILGMSVLAREKVSVNDGVVDSLKELRDLFEEHQDNWQELSLPGDVTLFQDYGLVVPFRANKLPKAFCKQLVGEYNADGIPLYRITCVEDWQTRQVIIYDSVYETELWRLKADFLHDPYAFLRWKYGLSALDTFGGIDPQEVLRLDSAKIAADFVLVPHIFYKEYVLAEEQRRLDEAASMPMMRSMSASDLQVDFTAKNNGMVALSLEWPDGYEHAQLDLFTTPDLINPQWRVACTNVDTTGTNQFVLGDVASPDLKQCFFAITSATQDSDGDHLADGKETYLFKTNPALADSDADGLDDDVELARMPPTDPLDEDSDNDDLLDGAEVSRVPPTDPMNEDSDYDGMTDGWEVEYGLDPTSNIVAEAEADFDWDFLSNIDEFELGTNPTLEDTEGDGFIDSQDLHPLDFDCSVAGEATFNVAVAEASRDWIMPPGFSTRSTMGGMSTTYDRVSVTWGDSDWITGVFRAYCGTDLERYNNSRVYSGSATIDYENQSNFWIAGDDLGLFPEKLISRARWGSLWGVNEAEISQSLGRDIWVLSVYREGVIVDHLCINVPSIVYLGSPHVAELSLYGYGPLKVSKYRFRARVERRASRLYGADYSEETVKFKMIFNQPVTNRVVKWISYSYDYDFNQFTNYVVHPVVVNGRESEEIELIAPLDSLLFATVPQVDLHADFDWDDDIDEADSRLRAPVDAVLSVLPPFGDPGDDPGTNGVFISSWSSGYDGGETTLSITGVDEGERFRLWGTSLMGSMAFLEGDMPNSPDNKILILDTDTATEYVWNSTDPLPYPDYLECLSCASTNDGRATLELRYEYEEEEICSAHLPIQVVKAEFIDEVPDYSLDANVDSDNFFLREYDGAGELDSENLDLYYRILPESLSVLDVKIRIYEGDTDAVVAEIPGVKDADGNFMTGDNLHTNWTASVDLEEEHPGFYRAQLEVYMDGNSEPICQTSIEDADDSTPGWQCPQDGLAIHDLTWKHRPMIHLHANEFSGPAQTEVMLDRADLLHNVVFVPQLDVAAPVAQADLADEAHNTTDYYLRYAGTAAEQDAARIRAPFSGERAVYHHSVHVNGENFVYLQSWHFEPSSFGVFSPFDFDTDLLTFTHDADWEMCQTAIRLAAPASDANNKAQWIAGYSVTASQHFRGQTLRWDEVGNGPDSPDQDYVGKTGYYRPSVYVANRTHATYFRPDAEFRFAATAGDTLAYEVAPTDGARDDYTGNIPYSYTLILLSDSILAEWLGDWSTQGVIPNLRSPVFRESSDEIMFSNPRGFNNRFLKSGNDNTTDPAYIQ